MNIISVVPTNQEDQWAVTLTIGASATDSITPVIHPNQGRHTAVSRALALYLGVTVDSETKIAVTDEAVRSLMWDALYSKGVHPDDVLTTDVPQGAVDAVKLLGGAR